MNRPLYRVAKAEKTQISRAKTLKQACFGALTGVILILSVSSVWAWTDTEICNAIYKAENSVKYPYGIKSIDTHGDPIYARKICMNTIRNNRGRFAKQTKHSDFIEFLGSRYCPPSAHSLNKHWVYNVRYFLQKGA